MKKFTSFFVLVTFAVSCMMPPQGFAQSLTAIGLMSQPGVSAALTPAFTPARLWGMAVHPDEPFNFDFLVQKGDVPLTDAQKQEEYARLIKYFLAALAVPDTDQWVNLSPYEQDRIIPDNFGATEMGRDVLAQDYLLKQLSSSLTNPDSDLGKKFWDGVYAQAYQRFGTTDVPTDTFNKVWIMPDKAVVYEKDNTVYVLESHLKVLTDKDYLAAKNNGAAQASVTSDQMADISSQLINEVIIPSIEKEVNEGQGFAPLRQIYSGMLLATWYKRTLKESILGKVYADRGKVKGVDQDPKANQEIYDQYVAAFKKGVFNMIKEEVDQYTQELIPRKYFSGGFSNTVENSMITETDLYKAQLRVTFIVNTGVERVKSWFKNVNGSDRKIDASQMYDFVRDANEIRNGLWHFIETFPAYEMEYGPNTLEMLRLEILLYRMKVNALDKNFPDFFKNDAQPGKKLFNLIYQLGSTDIGQVDRTSGSLSNIKATMARVKEQLKELDFDVPISLRDKDYGLIEALTDALFFNTVFGFLGNFDFKDIDSIKSKISAYVSDGQSGLATTEINEGVKGVGAINDQELEVYAKVIGEYVVSRQFTEQLLVAAKEKESHIPGNPLKTTSGLTRDKVEEIVNQWNDDKGFSIKTPEDVLTWVQAKQYKLLNSLLRNIGANRGFRMCGPASVVVSRILADLSGLPVGLGLEGDHIELQINIYSDGRPEGTEEHTYVKMYYSGEIIYIDTVLNGLTGMGTGIEVRAFSGENKEEDFREYLEKVRHLYPFDHNNKGIAQRGSFQGFSAEEIKEAYAYSMERINSDQWYLPTKFFSLKGNMTRMAVIESDNIDSIFNIFEAFFKNGSSRKTELTVQRAAVYSSLALSMLGDSPFAGFALRGEPLNAYREFDIASVVFNPQDKEPELNYSEAMIELKRIFRNNHEALARLADAQKNIDGLIAFSEKESVLADADTDKELKGELEYVVKGLRTFDKRIFSNNYDWAMRDLVSLQNGTAVPSALAQDVMVLLRAHQNDLSIFDGISVLHVDTPQGKAVFLQWPLNKPQQGEFLAASGLPEMLVEVEQKYPGILAADLVVQTIQQAIDNGRLVNPLMSQQGQTSGEQPFFRAGGLVFDVKLPLSIFVGFSELSLLNIVPGVTPLILALNNDLPKDLNPSRQGGIDFAQSNLDMQIKRDGNGIIFPVNRQDLDKIRIDGLVPVILDIQAVTGVAL